jgi:hypothetical protein
MAEMKPHLFLNNPRGENKKFNASRGRDEEPDKVDAKPANAYRPQKDRFNISLNTLSNSINLRRESRNLVVPAHLEFILVDFYVVFNDYNTFETKKRFKQQFGLVPVTYMNFNQSVLFAITDADKFAEFIKILKLFVDSADTELPSGKSYAISTIINDFKFLTTEEILFDSPEQDFIISIIDPTSEIQNDYDKIYKSLIEHITALCQANPVIKYSRDSRNIIELINASQEQISNIAKNYDVIYKIQSYRCPTIKENEFNEPTLTWDFTVDPPKDMSVLIGVLDNGVKPIKPIENIILDFGLDLTNPASPKSTQPKHPHGTVVATLAALGLDYFDTSKKSYIADAYIVPIKILDFNEGCFNIYEIEKAIRFANDNGVRIFTLAVTGGTKNYNSNISEFAYLLDKLTFQLDILIFISVGNLDDQDVRAINDDLNAGNNQNLHAYPLHFYNPNKSSDFHSCECSNLCSPSESYNNISVGAIAENKDSTNGSDLTPFKELPAYYTRKHYIDYLQKVNGVFLRESQKNYNLNKPDLVMPGGDYLGDKSRMQVVGFGLGANDFYCRDSGTSWSAPLLANIAAKILNNYPALNMQSVKALLINSSQKLLKDEFLDDLIEEIKEEEAQKNFNQSFNSLDPKDQKKLNSNISSSILYQRLVGHGFPDENKALFSGSKSVTLVVEDVIFSDSYKVININIPEYLLSYSKQESAILKLTATLSYKFFPVINNQLSYNPVHISFNFIKSVEKDDPIKTSEIISDRSHSYFNQFYEPLTGVKKDDDKMKQDARRKALGVKKNVSTWSEDFYPLSSKPFSNVQTFELNINPEEISKVDKQISLVVRCASKRDLQDDFMNVLKRQPHQFSIAINITEKANDELTAFDLHNEMQKINNLTSVVTIEGAIETDLEAEADL